MNSLILYQNMLFTLFCENTFCIQSEHCLESVDFSSNHLSSTGVELLLMSCKPSALRSVDIASVIGSYHGNYVTMHLQAFVSQVVRKERCSNVTVNIGSVCLYWHISGGCFVQYLFGIHASKSKCSHSCGDKTITTNEFVHQTFWCLKCLRSLRIVPFSKLSCRKYKMCINA